MCRNSPGGSAPLEPIRSRATMSWTWRPPPMFVSVLTWRSTGIWHSAACLTASRLRCPSQERRSQRRSGRHRRPPGLRRLRCRSPVPVPSMARLISRLDPTVLGLRIAAGDPALDDLAGELGSLTPSRIRMPQRPHDRHVSSPEPALISESYPQILAVFTPNRGVLRAKTSASLWASAPHPKTPKASAPSRRAWSILTEPTRPLHPHPENGHNLLGQTSEATAALAGRPPLDRGSACCVVCAA